jgi:hypothetical protein
MIVNKKYHELLRSAYDLRSKVLFIKLLNDKNNNFDNVIHVFYEIFCYRLDEEYVDITLEHYNGFDKELIPNLVRELLESFLWDATMGEKSSLIRESSEEFCLEIVERIFEKLHKKWLQIGNKKSSFKNLLDTLFLQILKEYSYRVGNCYRAEMLIELLLQYGVDARITDKYGDEAIAHADTDLFDVLVQFAEYDYDTLEYLVSRHRNRRNFQMVKKIEDYMFENDIFPDENGN